MPTVVEVPNVGEVEFPDSMSEQEIKTVLAQKFGGQQQAQAQDNDFFGAGVIEPIRAIGSGVAHSVLGGLAGAAAAPFTEQGTGAEIVESFQESAFKPETQAGQESLATLGDLMKSGIDLARVPISGLMGLMDLVRGQGLDQAVSTIRAIQGEGLGKTLGEATFEQTGSPLAATAAQVAPEAIAEVLGLKGAGSAVRAAPRAAKAATKAVAAPATVAKDIVKGVGEFQRPAKRRIAQMLEVGELAPETAGFQLAESTIKATSKAADTKLGQMLNIGKPKAVVDNLARDAINQGFSENVINSFKAASNADKSAIGKMADIAEKIRTDALFALRNRPSDVAGDTLMKRVKTIRNANKKAGLKINEVANKLKSQRVNVADIGDEFVNDLGGMGIRVTDDFKLDFRGSDIEGLAGPEGVLNRMMKRMSGNKNPSAHDVHTMKRFIDEHVTYGKTLEGLGGNAERVLKTLRTKLNKRLQENFPEYEEANKVYSETIGALDALQDVAGKKMNLTGDGADKATGTLMRRLMGNAQSRVNLLDAIDQIEDIANRHGGFGDVKRIEGKVASGPKDNLLVQVLAANEFDSVLGPAARSSLQGEFDAALSKAARAAAPGGVAGVAVDAATDALKKARGINEENAIKSIKALLKRK